MCSFLFSLHLGRIIYSVSFELIRKLTIKKRAHKKVDYKTKYFSLTPHVGCADKQANLSSAMISKHRLFAGT